MKKALPVFKILILIIILTACNSTEKNSDNQPVNSSSEQTEGSKERINPVKRGASNGSQLVENFVTKLHEKLELSDQQATDLENILIKTFVESGNDLEKEYSVEESKAIGKELKIKSYEPVLLILNEEQKVRFQKFMKK